MSNKPDTAKSHAELQSSISDENKTRVKKQTKIDEDQKRSEVTLTMNQQIPEYKMQKNTELFLIQIEM